MSENKRFVVASIGSTGDQVPMGPVSAEIANQGHDFNWLIPDEVAASLIFRDGSNPNIGIESGGFDFTEFQQQMASPSERRLLGIASIDNLFTNAINGIETIGKLFNALKPEAIDYGVWVQERLLDQKPDVVITNIVGLHYFGGAINQLVEKNGSKLVIFDIYPWIEKIQLLSKPSTNGNETVSKVMEFALNKGFSGPMAAHLKKYPELLQGLNRENRSWKGMDLLNKASLRVYLSEQNFTAEEKESLKEEGVRIASKNTDFSTLLEDFDGTSEVLVTPNVVVNGELSRETTAFLKASQNKDLYMIMLGGVAAIKDNDAETILLHANELCKANPDKAIILQSSYDLFGKVADAANARAHLADNLHLETFTHLPTIFAQAKGLIYHGGSGTTAQAARAGIPCIALQVIPEQGNNPSQVLPEKQHLSSGNLLDLIKPNFLEQTIARLSTMEKVSTNPEKENDQAVAGLIATAMIAVAEYKPNTGRQLTD